MGPWGRWVASVAPHGGCTTGANVAYPPTAPTAARDFVTYDTGTEIFAQEVRPSPADSIIGQRIDRSPHFYEPDQTQIQHGDLRLAMRRLVSALQ